MKFSITDALFFPGDFIVILVDAWPCIGFLFRFEKFVNEEIA